MVSARETAFVVIMVTLNVIAAPNLIMPQGGLVTGIYTPSPREGRDPPATTDREVYWG